VTHYSQEYFHASILQHRNDRERTYSANVCLHEISRGWMLGDVCMEMKVAQWCPATGAEGASVKQNDMQILNVCTETDL